MNATSTSRTLRFVQAANWADQNFTLFAGRRYQPAAMVKELSRFLGYWSGEDGKHLFAYSPGSGMPCCELTDGAQYQHALGMLGRIFAYGGMIFGGDFNGEKPTFIPLLVCNP